MKPAKSEKAPVYLLALLTLGLHLFFSARQGYFSDETYFIDCSRHLAFGYFDLTPLLPALVRLAHAVFGDSLFGLRFFPGLGHAATVLLGSFIAAELGGALFAQLLAGLSILIAPGFLMLGGLFLTPSLEPFFWTLVAYLVLRLIARQRPQLWLAAGVVAGAGFMNKPSILLFAVALGLGLFASPSRRVLFNRWFVFGVGAAALIVLPNLLWQARNEWNMIVFLRMTRDSALFKDAGGPAFVLGPLLALHPLNALLWIPGLGFLAFDRAMRPFRAFAWAYAILFAGLLLTGGKAYYLAGIYPLLLAAGAVFAERVTSAMRAGVKPARVSVAALFVAAGILLAPAGLPALSAEQTELYLDGLSMGSLSLALQLKGVRPDTEGKARDRFLNGLAQVYGRLSPAERESAVILAAHYFETSWINVLGARYGLPEAVSGNNSYYSWGPGPRTGETTIAIGFSVENLKAMFRDVAVAPENHAIAVCRHPVESLQRIWPRLKSAPFT